MKIREDLIVPDFFHIETHMGDLGPFSVEEIIELCVEVQALLLSRFSGRFAVKLEPIIGKDCCNDEG